MPLEPKALEALRIDRGSSTERYDTPPSKRWIYIVAAMVLVLGGVAFFFLRPQKPVVTTLQVQASAPSSAVPGRAPSGPRSVYAQVQI